MLSIRSAAHQYCSGISEPLECFLAIRSGMRMGPDFRLKCVLYLLKRLEALISSFSFRVKVYLVAKANTFIW